MLLTVPFKPVGKTEVDMHCRSWKSSKAEYMRICIMDVPLSCSISSFSQQLFCIGPGLSFFIDVITYLLLCVIAKDGCTLCHAVYYQTGNAIRPG